MNLNIVDYVSNVNYILKIILPNKKDDHAIAFKLSKIITNPQISAFRFSAH